MRFECGGNCKFRMLYGRRQNRKLRTAMCALLPVQLRGLFALAGL